jgi:hypothetical protein
MRTTFASLVTIVALGLAPVTASALTRAQSDYPFDQVWNAAVRLVRVDLGFEVTERDSEGGFILFKYRADMGGTFNASLEIVRAPTDGKVGLVVQIPEMPRYAELWLLDRLNRKLRDEYGAPPPRVRRPATPGLTPPRGEGNASQAGNRNGNRSNGRTGGNGAGRSNASASNERRPDPLR